MKRSNNLSLQYRVRILDEMIVRAPDLLLPCQQLLLLLLAEMREPLNRLPALFECSCLEAVEIVELSHRLGLPIQQPHLVLQRPAGRAPDVVGGALQAVHPRRHGVADGPDPPLDGRGVVPEPVHPVAEGLVGLLHPRHAGVHRAPHRGLPGPELRLRGRDLLGLLGDGPRVAEHLVHLSPDGGGRRGEVLGLRGDRRQRAADALGFL